MAGTRRRRRRNVNRRRRNRRAGLRGRAMTTAPPRLSITSNTRTLQISCAFDVTSNVVRKDIKFSDVFSYPPNIGLTFQFREGRVLNARVYWQSDNATSDSGSVCLTVEDYTENVGTDVCPFNQLLSYPGSMVRKVWQNVSNRWFPTEPTDREFQELTGDSGILTVTVRHSVPNSNLKGRVVLLMSVRLRGKTTARCPQRLLAALELLEQQENEDRLSTASMEMIRMQPDIADDP